jgi:hypothetical protein
MEKQHNSIQERIATRSVVEALVSIGRAAETELRKLEKLGMEQTSWANTLAEIIGMAADFSHDFLGVPAESVVMSEDDHEMYDESSFCRDAADDKFFEACSQDIEAADYIQWIGDAMENGWE